MATSNFTNSDFINAHTSITDLISALASAGVKRKGVKSQTKSKEQALQAVDQEIKQILQSPLRKTQPSGYGALPLDAVQPIRQLHNALSLYLEQLRTKDDDDQDDKEEPVSLGEVHGHLTTLVRVIDPEHPFLSEEQYVAEEGEVGRGSLEAGASAPRKSKNKTHAPPRPKRYHQTKEEDHGVHSESGPGPDSCE